MKDYDIRHDTGDQPCSEGDCCIIDRERALASSMVEDFRDDVPEHIRQSRLQAGLVGDDQDDEVDELIMLMDKHWRRLTLADMCEAVGISRPAMMKLRRKYTKLEEATTDFLAAIAEDEFETGSRGMAASVLGHSLEKLVPTFARDAAENLTDEDKSFLVRTIADVLKAHITSLQLAPEQEAAFMQGVATSLAKALSLR